MSALRRAGFTPETGLFLVLAAIAIVGSGVFGTALSDANVVLMLAIGVAIAGLPHGALDPWVARRAGLWRSWRGAVGFHLAYVGAAAVVVLAWQFAPNISLALFLAVSAWHFAGDWRAALPAPLRAAAGLALLALPAWRWPLDVAGHFDVLAGAEGRVLAGVLASVGPWLAAAMVGAALVALRRAPAAAAELVALGALALLLPPLAYFTVYFCALHSPRHLRLAAVGVAASARRRMAGVALLYTVLTVLVATLAWPWWVNASAPTWSADLQRLVFIGLAALTVPHMAVVMHAEQLSVRAP
jgi:Brp/Blh family beta-carotene 15,15'-monooxygenase